MSARLWGKLITWAHTSLASGHLGTRMTYKLIQDKYWWPNMFHEVNQFVTSCSS